MDETRAPESDSGTVYSLDPGHLQNILDRLHADGFTTIGPVIRQGAVVPAEIRSLSDLPAGWTDEQDGGRYRLKKSPEGDGAYFGVVNGPRSMKEILYPPEQLLWRAEQDGSGFEIATGEGDLVKRAFIGVRSCDLHALDVLDRVFLRGPYIEPGYRARREGIFIVAVNCTRAGGTCFCASMGTGPRATGWYDLVLTELPDGDRHVFVAGAGTEAGRRYLEGTGAPEAGREERDAADRLVEEAAGNMGREMDTDGIKELLYRNYESPRWDDVASRCLACTNCTLVCPTCFCATVEDRTDIGGKVTSRRRLLDSCFTREHSYIHGGSIRTSRLSRYRQWLVHKVATWIDQFGVSGCVGCGRCITWCPVAIDITEEVRAIRNIEQREKGDTDGHA